MTDPSQPLTTHAADFRDAIVAGIRVAFPATVVPTVTIHDGPADVGFIERYATASPAIILTVLGGNTTRVGGTLRDVLQIGAYIITRGTTQKQRTDGALAIRERLIKLGFLSNWITTECYKAPDDIASTNLFDSGVDEMGLALWLVAWENYLEIPYLEDIESLDAFVTLWQEIFNPGSVEQTVETGKALTEQRITLDQE